MSKVAVIGCGAFGAAIALRLQSDGDQVTIYERLPAILSGASFNNQNRLHLGYHYPRDAQTAEQCMIGFKAFQEAFPNCCAPGFPNGYFIAGAGSRTSAAAFFEFCERVGLPARKIAPDEFVPAVSQVACGIITDEIVYDSHTLRATIQQRLERSAAALEVGVEVTAATVKGPRIELLLSTGQRETYDLVVNSTYAASSHLSEMLGVAQPARQYEYTVVPIIRTPFPRIGITIMDGPFMSILPFGASDQHLLYHVEHSVIDRHVQRHIDRSWLDQAHSPFAAADRRRIFEAMIEDSVRFIPALARAEVTGFLHGPRMVLANRDDTDARPSLVERQLPNYVTVFSGKIDHCLGVAGTVATIAAEIRQGR
jgi:glycine/D-amino acid oxidase-like deaminating enzyme